MPILNCLRLLAAGRCGEHCRLFFRRLLVLSLLAICGVIAIEACLAAGADGSNPPNVVVILTDDQGWGDLSLHGNTNLATPRVDALARGGAQIERFFVCPVCAPTRAEFLTGRYHSRGGVHGVSTGAERLNLDEKTIADAFRAAGYATAAFGKWHNGTQYPYHPKGRGFDVYYGFCSGHWGHYFDPVLEHNGQLVRGRGFIIDDLTNHALEFIESHRRQPFFCYVAFNTPHSPFQVPDRFYEKFASNSIEMRHRDPQKEELDKTRAALAMCENIDWNVGRILDKLDVAALADNTIVVYFTDNGPNSWRFNGDMKGRKGSTDEGGVRVPCFIRWPGHIRAGITIPQIAGAIDLAPTLSELAGISLVGEKPLDGISLVPWLLEETDEATDRMIFSHQSGRVSVRTARYRADSGGALFDLTADPGQRHDIADREPATAAKLATALKQWKRDVVRQAEDDDRPFTVGYREFPVTYLPARDGVAKGQIQRSARAPNCSYFTGWVDAADTITWDIAVESPGAYEAVVYYTCAKENVGAKISLGFAGSRIEATVAEAHDPPLIGAEADRVPREGESYVKTFRPLSLGTFELEKGRGPLTLGAVEMPGKGVIDVRCVALTLKE